MTMKKSNERSQEAELYMFPPGFTRRAFLRTALGTVGVALLAACSKSKPNSSQNAKPTGTAGSLQDIGQSGPDMDQATGTTVAAPTATVTPVPPTVEPATVVSNVSVFPIPNSRTASPQTEISFRGLPADKLGTVRAIGSKSGEHSGMLMEDSDGNGASYLPDASFEPGEQVKVMTSLKTPGGDQVEFSFNVADPVTQEVKSNTMEPKNPKHVQRFLSQPDWIAPTFEVATQAHDTAPGYIFIAPKNGDGQDGNIILDNNGQIVWFDPLAVEAEETLDFKVQQYKGQPSLTWWEGISAGGHGLGHFSIADSSYRNIVEIRASNGYPGGDLHDMRITPQGTALFPVYNVVRWDLSSVKGPKDGKVMEGIIQEIDIPTGRVLFEWHSLDHIGLDESYVGPSKDPNEVFDYFHMNSLDVDHDGNIIVSSRYTWAVYKVDRKTGQIIWRMDGKKSDFKMGDGTKTAYQHDARILPNGDMTIFDNGAMDDNTKVHDHSRGVVLKLDTDNMTVSLVKEYVHPGKVLAESQGNVQVLPNGNVFIGWGSEPLFSEFNADGDLLFDVKMSKDDESYRAYRFEWAGRPTDTPAVAAEAASDGEITIYASWNGATEVADWQILAGQAADQLAPVGSAPREGFETAIRANIKATYVAVQARDGSGQVLGTSNAVKVST